MQKDFMTLGGREVRVEVNWNAIIAFLGMTGQDDFDMMSCLGKMIPSQSTALIAAAVNEGERLEGRESHLTDLDVGAVIHVNEIKAFTHIYMRHTAVLLDLDEGSKKKDAEKVKAEG